MKTKKILLIDDDLDFVIAISTMLKSHGFETELAYSAEEGYQKTKTFKPDLIILDVYMETNNAGFDLSKKLRTDDEFRSVPVIMLTGIDTISASDQIVELYRQINNTPGFENNTVLKVRNADGSISVDYKTESGCNYFLPLDSFMSKPVEFESLLLEVKRFLKD
ncbi:MAG: response regulator [Bacteroidales bacterium]